MNTQVRLNIERRMSFTDGAPFGDAGPYERLVGSVNFALDPGDPRNANVVDLLLAPRNANGSVEFRADLDILKPVDLNRGNGRLLYDVNNRGNKTALRAFNDAPAGNDPQTLAAAGNGFLMRQGFTIVWSGWQGDLIAGDGLLTVDLPEALEDGKPLRGTVRQEFIAEQETLSMPLSGAPDIHSYPALDLDTAHATMTLREREQDPRVPLAPDAWAFAEAETVGGELQLRLSSTACYVKGGFKPGWIYELTYETEGSRVMGLGLVGIRDLMSMLLHDATDADGAPNPVAGQEKAYLYGQSLSARVIRQFIYDGYNVDPEGRKVFDAVYSHVSGAGRLFTNARFAQVGRYPRQHEEHQWPSERYPFAYSAVPDAFSDKMDSVLKRPRDRPVGDAYAYEHRILEPPCVAWSHGPAHRRRHRAPRYGAHLLPGERAAYRRNAPAGRRRAAASQRDEQRAADAGCPDADGPLGNRWRAAAPQPRAPAGRGHARHA